MSLPREVIPGRTYFISRRVTQRQFLMLPTKVTNATFAYCLGEAAQRFKISLCGWLPMSNHYHSVVYDPHGNLPAFLEHLHKMLAKALNAHWGRHENFWSSTETSVVYLATPEDIFDKLVYVLSNPITDHLVDRLVDWPGFSSLHHMTGKVSIHERPKQYFRLKGGKMKAEVSIRTELPPCITERWTSEAWFARVRDAVDANERAAREERLRTGRRVLGRKAILKMSPTHRPSTPEARNLLLPAVACKNEERRILELAKLKHFRNEHTRARKRFVAGERDVEFPAGTYRMRLLGARCAPFPVAA